MPEKRKRPYDPAKRRAAYLRSKARAAQLGYTSPSQRTRARGMTSEQYRAKVAQARKKTRSVFDVHVVTRAEVERMHRENLAHTPEGIDGGNPRTALARRIQTYTLPPGPLPDFSDQTVGYVVSFYRAVTDGSTNFYSISPSERWVRENAGTAGEWRATQYAYLVTYAGFYDLSDFDERYGDGATAAVILNNALGQ